MDVRIVLVLALCIQGLLADGRFSNDEAREKRGPLTDDEKAKIAEILQNLKKQGEEFRAKMQKHAASFPIPGLAKLADGLVGSVNKEVEGFANFNEKRLSDPNNTSPFTRYRKSFDRVKNLERGFLSTLQNGLKEEVPQTQPAAAAATPGRRSVSPGQGRRAVSPSRATRTPPRSGQRH